MAVLPLYVHMNQYLVIYNLLKSIAHGTYVTTGLVNILKNILHSYLHFFPQYITEHWITFNVLYNSLTVLLTG
jgi:hypothetical protein